MLSVRTDDGRSFRFSRSFHIGREHDCDVRIEDAQVSRKHAMVSFEDGRWLLRDPQSGNGVFVNGRRVETVAIDNEPTIRLGADGPLLTLEVDPAALPPRGRSTPTGRRDDAPRRATPNATSAAARRRSVGERTMMIRKAFHTVQKKQKRLYIGIVAAVVAGGAERGRVCLLQAPAAGAAGGDR